MEVYQKTVASFVNLAYAAADLPPSKFPPLPKHPLAQAGAQVMQPFLGEMGLEVRGFLGQIEPWLRSGWVIPARRTCLYPRHAVFEDPEYFARVDEIKREYGLREMVSRLAKVLPPQVGVSAAQSGGDYHFHAAVNMEEQLQPVLMAQRDLRRAFFDRYGHDMLVPTRWHVELSSLSHGDDAVYLAARRATVPSYLPELFANPPFEYQPHIGIQLRNVPANPDRNSDPVRMGHLAALASRLLNLPVLVYGKPSDQPLGNYPRTFELLPAGTPQMNAEMVFLHACKLMISPDSGWADLMGWLRVPTLLERVQFPWGFEALRPFGARMALASDDAAVTAFITEVCLNGGGGTVLPDPGYGLDPASQFLHPAGKDCRQFWQEYYGKV